MVKQILVCLSTYYFLSGSFCFSQSVDTTGKILFSGYVDAYYAFYTDSVGLNNFQQFPSVDPRSKTFGLNTAMVTAQYESEKVKGIITLHYGDIAKSAWSPVYNNIMEAHASVRIVKKIWLAAGFFRTHFGTEGLLPKENITSSVSINTFFEPYLESGLRLKYEASDKFFINFYALNGYNIFEENNDKKSFGILAIYTCNSNCNIGYSNYVGDDSKPGDSLSHLRIHQNLFLNYQYRSIKLQVGGDFCIQENSKLSDTKKSASMYSGVISLKEQATVKSGIYLRGEIFNDPDGYMSGMIINNEGLEIKGITAGYEFKPTDNSYLRLEWRELIADKDQKIFYYKGSNRNHRSEVLFNIGVSF